MILLQKDFIVLLSDTFLLQRFFIHFFSNKDGFFFAEGFYKDDFKIVQKPDTFFLQKDFTIFVPSAGQLYNFDLVQTYFKFPQQKDFMFMLSDIFILFRFLLHKFFSKFS